MRNRKLARILAISGVALILSACSTMDSEALSSEVGMTDTETSLAESNAMDSEFPSVVSEPQPQTEVVDSSSYERTPPQAWQKFDELVKWPIIKPLELTVEEKAQFNKFIEQNKSLLEERPTSLKILATDVTGDGCPEIVLYYYKNGDQEFKNVDSFNFTGMGEVYDLETFAYMGDLYGDFDFNIGWYQEDNSKKCYSLELNRFRNQNPDFQVYKYVYILWEILYDGQKTDCSPRWVYAIQRTEELIEGEDCIKEECFSIDSPDKEDLIAWRIDPDRPFDVLRKSSTPGLSNEIKESLASLQPVASYWTLYAFINSEGELVIK